jgi:adenosylcobinamide-GDP ribazoletransferase
MSALSELRAAVAFLTPFHITPSGLPPSGLPPSGLPPFGRTPAVEPDPPPSPLTMTYFPLVGAAIGGLVGLTWWRARRSFSPVLAATLAVVADCAFTGALHLDGLADTADGLFAHVPAKNRLAIMSEPGVGSFAVVALGLAIVSRVAALAALEPSPVLLGALYCSSRSVMVIGSRVLPYARQEGLASAFLPSKDGPGCPDQALLAALAGAGAALGVASAVAGRRGAAAVVVGWATAAAVLESARRRLGGFTGDVLGAAGVVCETSGLVVAAGGTGA